ncbi:hypothetical protein OGAPHI_006912 [Ogataea philodendri]|uniref:dolichol kinase n=1 Tax=Ogataea philodendri TaxID=1378263 RepID=A0A9P8NW65_9ASCO|nr:uncharacterized protein OGAPHI_006912 [Ogataea philodendri]KAH3660326.1 hypothetical protein OGAPHI_006912 [Ogataea philodendri]
MAPRKQPTKRVTRSQSAQAPSPVAAESESLQVQLPTKPSKQLENPLQVVGATQYVYELIEAESNVSNWVQWFVLLFVGNVVFLLFKENEDPSKFDPQHLYDAMFALLCVFCQIAVVFHHQWKKYKISGNNAPQLPEFNLLYATFIPLAVSLLQAPKYLILLGGCVTLVSDLQIVVQIGVAVLLEVQLVSSHDSYHPTFPIMALTPVWHLCVQYLLQYVAPKSFTKSDRNIIATLSVVLLVFIDNTSPVYLQILQKLMVSFASATGLCYPIYIVYQKTERNWAVLALLQIVFYILGFHLSTYFLTPVLSTDPFSWLDQFIQATETRWTIFRAWLGAVFVVLPAVFAVKSYFPLDVRRKVWHFALFGALAYPLVLDSELVSLALVGLFGLLLLVELQRALRLPPIGAYLDTLFVDFLDDKDRKGEVLSSYIYLVLGAALPIWFDSKSQEAVAGIITVGLGDSIASLVGKRLGANRWPGTNKTVEGSVAFVLATLASLSAFRYFGQNEFSYSNILCTSMLAAIVEGCTTMNDNLLVPVFTYLCLYLFKHF